MEPPFVDSMSSTVSPQIASFLGQARQTPFQERSRLILSFHPSQIDFPMFQEAKADCPSGNVEFSSPRYYDNSQEPLKVVRRL